MGEREVIEATKNGPITTESLQNELTSLGLEPGMTVLVHSSLSSMGWICGGAQALIMALEAVIRPYGNLVMPTHSGDLSDPSGWSNPPVPEEWWEEIRRTMPAFDPDLTPTRGVGRVPEVFRKQADVIRSSHPQVSFAAWGEKCVELVQNHSLDFGLGEASPLAKIYDIGGWVLLLGVDHTSNTSLHLAENRAKHRKRQETDYGGPIIVDGHRRWKKYRDIDFDVSDFDDFDHDFRRDNDKEIRVGLVGNAKCQLFSQRLCVDYAVKWFERKRR
ncbi:MAG: AAC(3) family N-acetyltransferase [Spirochaetales bacterium]|jgi:aminoglycoside 3-N-acetyltransferase|nr:AAC(3) family N-acetyltransferase [Spirochaetales bacterium]